MAIKAEIKGGKLIIEADLDGKNSSKTGKSTLLASTGGFIQLPDNMKYSLNVIQKK